MNYEIFADVSIDIDKKFAEENQVRYIPMEYMLGEDSFPCTEPESDEMMHHYYEKLRHKIPTHTSQIVPHHYMEIFEPLVKQGTAILYISLSSGLSNTYESALMAVKMLKEDYENVNIEVVDSLAATGGMGLLTESACENRKNGMSLSENAAWLREKAAYVNLWFKVEDLMYLSRGGRISTATAILGTALNLKPILTVDSAGRLQTIDKKRGNRQAFRNLLERFESNFDAAVSNVVYISCADCMEDAAVLKEMVLEKHPELTVRTTMLSPIIGAHTGPDMISLIYYGTDRPKA